MDSQSQSIKEEIGKLKVQNQLDLFDFKVDVVAEYPDMVESLIKAEGEII